MDRKAKLEYLRSRIEVRDGNFDGCWIFTGGIMKNGYGITSWGADSSLRYVGAS
jgi:hypothetical protein